MLLLSIIRARNLSVGDVVGYSKYFAMSVFVGVLSG
jgi:hypothetical protein